MKKPFGLVLLALLAVPLLLMGCSSEPPEEAKDYVEALLGGDAGAAQQIACESFQGRTGELAAYFSQNNVRDWDLKYDVGKGGRQEETIVTGAFTYGPEDVGREIKLQEKDKTRIVVWMYERGDGWCVNEKTTVGENLLALRGGAAAPAVESETPAEEATEAATEEPTEAATEEAGGAG